MKRFFTLAVLALLLINTRALAADKGEFSNILNDAVSERGAFDGHSGVIFASIEQFYYDTDMLLVCSADGAYVDCAVYAVNDGAECIDILTLDMSGGAILSVVTYDDMSYLMLDKSGKIEYFTILDDSFTHIPPIVYSHKRDIVRFGNGAADVFSNTPQELYNFLNSMRLETINSYTYMNKVNIIDTDEKEKLIQFLTSCSGLTEFDCANYDYDRIFKYVLFTHKAFEPLLPINPHTGESSGINTVSAEFIDRIMTDFLKIPPEHPPVTSLTDRGFCYRDGMYMYTGGFSADYRTEILDLLAVHDLGGGNYHVVFSDIYYENGNKIPEYSFAIVNESNGALSLARLGMGKNLLTEHQINRYSVIENMRAPAWEKQIDAPDSQNAPAAPDAPEQRARNAIILTSSLAALFAAIAAAWWYIVLRKK